MTCLGILVDTAAFTLEVPTTHLKNLLAELTTWRAVNFFTRKQLQYLLGKLFFITACVKLGRIFMARNLNSLHECKRPRSHHYHLCCYAFGHTVVAGFSSPVSSRFSYQAYILGFRELPFFHRLSHQVH